MYLYTFCSTPKITFIVATTDMVYQPPPLLSSLVKFKIKCLVSSSVGACAPSAGQSRLQLTHVRFLISFTFQGWGVFVFCFDSIFMQPPDICSDYKVVS